MNKRALLIIDLQQDFCPGGSLAVADGDAVVPVINRLLPFFSLIVATRDWHPAGHISFAASHPGKKPFDSLQDAGRSQTLWPIHCVAGSPGADFHPGLNLIPVHLIVHKGTKSWLDSYSAFFENDRKTPTGLESYLKGLGVQELFLCGLAYDVCVLYSALDAAQIGFRTSVITDGCRSVDIPAGNMDSAAAEMQAAGIRLVQSTELERI